MRTTPPASVEITYAAGYTRGRNAAKEHVSIRQNPFQRGSSAYQGWNDGHYDEQSARALAIGRHSAEIWSDGEN
jgi:hypothetical protein